MSSSSTTRRWVAAHAVGLLSAMVAFAAVADNPLMPESEAGELASHLAGFLAFAAVFTAVQRQALTAATGRVLRTSFLAWTAALGVAVWLGYGLAYALAGPPLDFVAAVVIVGLSSGLLLAREARVRPGRLLARGALAGVLSVVAMVPGVALAGPLDDLLGGGLPPFLVVVALIGLGAGTCLGTVLRPALPAGEPARALVSV